MGQASAVAVTIYESPLNDQQDAEFHPQYVPRPNPLPIPEPNIFDAPTMCIKINEFWASHLIGALDVLDQTDSWIGTPEEQEAARQQVRELIARLGGYCMDDPCCPDLVESAQISNLTDIQNLYNQYMNANNQQATANQGIYDGTAESVYFNAGADFSSGGAGVLCSAIDNFVGQLVGFVGARTALAAAGIGVATSAAIAALVAMGVFTGGASIVAGVVLGASLAIALADVEEAWNNPTAQQKVKCCMFDALNGQVLDRLTFETSLSLCGFDEGSPEERIRLGLAPMLAEEANWTAFLQCLNIAQDGGTDRCNCTCAVEDLVLVPMTPETTAEKLTDTTWRIISSYKPADDPARPDARVATIRDQFYRCVDFVSSTQGMVDGSWVDCANEDGSTLGFPATTAIRISFRQDAEDIDTVLTIACGEA